MSKRMKLRGQIQGDTRLKGAIREQVDGDDHAGEGELQVVPVDKIDLNPKNPRRLGVSASEAKALYDETARQVELSTGAKPDKVFFEALEALVKQAPDPTNRGRLERLVLLTKSINSRGLINPIAVYSGGDDPDERPYMIMAGERRYLAHLLCGRPTIRALIRQRSGDDLDDRVGSLVENIAREDLTTADKIDSIEELVALHKSRHGGQEITSDHLHDLIHESMRTCQRYLRILSAPPMIRKAIRTGELSTLGEIDSALRDLDRATLRDPAAARATTKVSRKAPRGRQRTGVTLGKTSNVRVIQGLMSAWLGKTAMKKRYADVDWEDLNAAQAAWKSFLKTVEESSGNNG